jgi:hypothetical protein
MANRKSEYTSLQACCNCSSTLGPSNKMQPTNVDGELWCPRCFTWKRANLEPERFNSSQTVAAQCQFCGWKVVCFGIGPGQRLTCNHCGRGGCMPLMPDPDDVAKIAKDLGV